MPELKQILVVEDELTNSILLKRILSKAGYSVVVANNGLEAIKHLEREKFDAVLTDWMMPQVDGIELIRRMRANVKPLPFIVMITALVSEGARAYALESGADDFIAKPIEVEELLVRLKDGLARHQQTADDIEVVPVTRELDVNPPYVAVAIATSTGGPPALIELFKKMPEKVNAPFFIVQHGPSWMLETFSQRLQRETAFNVTIAYDGIIPEPDNIYIAPGDKHMRIDPKTYKITVDDGPKENFVRPAADPLFRSVAEAFGKYSIAVILTGLGKDGAQGAAHIASVKGNVIVQDPATATAPSMPTAVVQSGINCKVLPISAIGKEISELIFPLNASLKMALKNQN
ncbi:MAG TPA: chemotaxis protein CheB [Candidatus Kapabacteria bacterium]|nr:chemotaxis protein CheB [Candidatus Kapabacteria bacterium]